MHEKVFSGWQRYMCRGAVWAGIVAFPMAVAFAGEPLVPRIVNGLLTSDFPTTGALLHGTSAGTARVACSGTLIGCSTFLTAAHCIEDDPSPSRYFVFLQHGGVFSVTSMASHPSYDFPVADVAVLKLESAVTGIRPTRINDVQDPPFGTPGWIAGFGRSGGSNQDYGLKRYGAVTTSSCSAAGESNVTSVCWAFSAPQGAPGSNSNTCHGDSGGPLFLTLGGNEVVAGITSGGVLDSCLTGDVGYDTDVHNYRVYIQNQGGADLANTTCGSGPQVGDSDVSVDAFSGSLNSGTPQATHSLNVEPGTSELRVALNAIDSSSTDFDLYVKHGSEPSTIDYDCRRHGSNQYGVCSFTDPAAGAWFAKVVRFSGSGTYQLTTTQFGAGCADPNQAGMACDDNDPCTSNDICSDGICQGTVVSDGTSCGSGTLCSGPATCQAGICTTAPQPATGCKQTVAPARAAIHVSRSNRASSNKVQWKWKGQASFDFGNPTTATTYALCAYDTTAGVPRLVLDHSAPSGALWQPLTNGFKYNDSRASNDGLRSIKLRGGSDGKASLQVLARGAGIDMPNLPLDQDPTVRVQLVNNHGQCWEAYYSSHSSNTSLKLKAKSD